MRCVPRTAPRGPGRPRRRGGAAHGACCPAGRGHGGRARRRRARSRGTGRAGGTRAVPAGAAAARGLAPGQDRAHPQRAARVVGPLHPGEDHRALRVDGRDPHGPGHGLRRRGGLHGGQHGRRHGRCRVGRCGVGHRAGGDAPVPGAGRQVLALHHQRQRVEPRPGADHGVVEHDRPVPDRRAVRDRHRRHLHDPVLEQVGLQRHVPPDDGVVPDLHQVVLGEVGRRHAGPPPDPGAEQPQHRRQQRGPGQHAQQPGHRGGLVESGDELRAAHEPAPQRLGPRPVGAHDQPLHRCDQQDQRERRGERQHRCREHDLPRGAGAGHAGQPLQEQVDRHRDRRGGQRGAEELDAEPLRDAAP